MPSKKGSQAYDARNARRRIDTAIKSLNKSLKAKGTSINERAAIRGTIKQLKTEKEATYQKAGRKSEEIQAAMIRGSRLAKSTKILKGPHGTSNISTQFQLNLATKKLKEGEVNVSRYTRGEAKAFYRATQNIWQTPGGTNIAEINQIILSYFKDQQERDVSLEEAVDIVLSDPRVREAADSYDLGTKRNRSRADNERMAELREGDTTDGEQTSEIGLYLSPIYDVDETQEE